MAWNQKAGSALFEIQITLIITAPHQTKAVGSRFQKPMIAVAEISMMANAQSEADFIERCAASDAGDA